MPPVITAAEPEHGAWCPVCLEHWRLRVPILADGVLAACLEICPGCGTGHDKSAVYAVPVAAGPEPAPPPVPRRERMLARLREWQERVTAGVPGAPECAYGTCCRRTRRRTGYAFQAEDGMVRFYFCSSRHRRAWVKAHDLPS